ncbi:GHKL domain-containing protein [Aerococcaceae bacterium DSM 111021]|uniref:GHKL domain-containing protein n=1 Tax=Ruoffia tabacinasalis TaxID=87458 RepID=A0A5R9EG57_9LACT|nr:sensor histidine kinase [Ruoffia tabacinasalis]MBZ6527945.1 GHKL domain-containing protein [Aerococcaceae bacterium DSM 111021]TLQ49092.1 GHKL domain-containing protein [Ruoffia tabacinasalis]
MDFFNIFYAIVNPFYLYILWLYFTVWFGKSSATISNKLLIWLISYLAITFSFLFIQIPYITLITNLASFSLILSLFKGVLSKKILSVFILVSCLLSIEILVVSLFNNPTPTLIKQYNFQNITSLVLSYLIEYVLVKYLIRRKYNFISIYNNRLLSFSQLVIPLLTTIVFLIFIKDSSISEFQFITLALFFILINVILFELYDALSRSFNLLSEQQNFKQEQLDYANQLKMIKSHDEEWREFRHDLANRLTPLYGFVDQYPNRELQDIIFDIVPEPLKEPISKTGHIAIDSIINTKLQPASTESINLTTEIWIPKKIKIDSIDLAVLLGNLLDNAIEGCLTIQENRFIDIKLLFESNQLKLRISNSFDGEVDKQGERILSRKRNNNIHGFGLSSVQKIVNKYDGMHDIHYTHDSFSIKILLFEPVVE